MAVVEVHICDRCGKREEGFRGVLITLGACTNNKVPMKFRDFPTAQVVVCRECADKFRELFHEVMKAVRE